jgi:hypothetical protein
VWSEAGEMKHRPEPVPAAEEMVPGSCCIDTGVDAAKNHF